MCLFQRNLCLFVESGTGGSFMSNNRNFTSILEICYHLQTITDAPSFEIKTILATFDIERNHDHVPVLLSCGWPVSPTAAVTSHRLSSVASTAAITTSASGLSTSLIGVSCCSSGITTEHKIGQKKHHVTDVLVC